MPRIIIKPKDISALSIIAQNPEGNADLVKNLSASAKPIGQALTRKKRRGRRQGKAATVADSLMKWVSAEG
jgi:hypothetical protein